MILSTHTIVGAAIASFMPSHPEAAFVLDFASHFVLDAIPHWDYPIRSPSVDPTIGAPLTFDRALLRDAVTIGCDALFGILAGLYLFSSSDTRWVILLGAFGALLPDVFQFVHARFPHEPLRSLQRFHRWMHTDKQLKNETLVGIGSQVFLVGVIVSATLVAHGSDPISASATAAGAHTSASRAACVAECAPPPVAAQSTAGWPIPDFSR
jgi:hypothetical protein